MNQKQTLYAGIITAGLGVAIGAFGAHALKPLLAENGKVEVYETAVRYQFYHAFALVVAGILMNQFKAKQLGYAALCFLGGIILFSGSLYALCFTGVKVLGAVTPVGGVFFLVGWFYLLVGVKQYQSITGNNE